MERYSLNYVRQQWAKKIANQLCYALNIDHYDSNICHMLKPLANNNLNAVEIWVEDILADDLHDHSSVNRNFEYFASELNNALCSYQGLMY